MFFSLAAWGQSYVVWKLFRALLGLLVFFFGLSSSFDAGNFFILCARGLKFENVGEGVNVDMNIGLSRSLYTQYSDDGLVSVSHLLSLTGSHTLSLSKENLELWELRR